jgi:UDP-glucose 4-epimerase
MKGKSILVTGGAGFIGSHLVDALLAREASAVIVVDNLFLGSMENLAQAQRCERLHFYREDAADLSALDQIIAQHRVEAVFNLATKALLYSFANPEGAYMVNVEIMRTLLYLQRKGAFQTLIHCSSSEAYGTAQTFPMDESHPYAPATPYAAGKAAADLMALSYAHTFGNELAIIRPFNNYGPRQNKDRGLEAVIPLTAARLMRGEAPVIYGDGEQTRDFIFVEDTVAGLLAAYEKSASRGQVINLASGEELSIAAVIKGVCAYFNYEGEIEYRPARPADVRRHRGDIQRARELLGFAPKVGFEEGLRRTLDWYTQRA